MKFFTHRYESREKVEMAVNEFHKTGIKMVSMCFVPYFPDKENIQNLIDLGLSLSIPNPFGEFVVMWENTKE